MCTVYNTIGSLTTIKTRLAQHGIHDFHSIHELLAFQRAYPTRREQLLSDQRALAIRERDALSQSVLEAEQQLDAETRALELKFEREFARLRNEYEALANAEKTYLQEFTYSFKAVFKLLKSYYLRLTSRREIARAMKPKVEQLVHWREQLQRLTDYFESVVRERSLHAVRELDHKQRVIDELKQYIYGAIGEHKVVETLKQLPDDYILINDFSYTFHKPPYYKQQNTRIRTIQLDHILISPAGVFIIETKNWSKASVQNLNLRSPVDQIQRTNYALFILLHRTGFKLGAHHWGERKISIRNLIVLINHKPREEFQYVKVLTLNELVRHVTYFQPSLSREETREIAEYLIGINDVQPGVQ